MNCTDMMQIAELEDVLKLKAGEKGLWHLVRWIYFADCLQCIKSEYKIEKSANATGYDVVLGTSSKKENGETRPYNYGAHKVLNLKEGTVTATFKNVPKGTWVVGMHAFNRTSEDGKKVFSPWSNLKKATVK